MPNYRSLISRVENLHRSVAAAPPTTEAFTQLSLLANLARADAEGYRLALCARARARAQRAGQLVESSRALIKGTKALLLQRDPWRLREPSQDQANSRRDSFAMYRDVTDGDTHAA